MRPFKKTVRAASADALDALVWLETAKQEERGLAPVALRSAATFETRKLRSAVRIGHSVRPERFVTLTRGRHFRPLPLTTA